MRVSPTATLNHDDMKFLSKLLETIKKSEFKLNDENNELLQKIFKKLLTGVEGQLQSSPEN